LASDAAMGTGLEALGSRFVRRLLPLLQEWHRQARERNLSPPRVLQSDQYVLLIAHGLFQPLAEVVRELRQAEALPAVQERLGAARAAQGDREEALALFDEHRLRRIVREVGLPPPAAGTTSRLAPIPPTQPLLPPAYLHELPQLVRGVCLPAVSQAAVGWSLPTHFHWVSPSSGPGTDRLAPPEATAPVPTRGIPRSQTLCLWEGEVAHLPQMPGLETPDSAHLGWLSQDYPGTVLTERPLGERDRDVGITRDRLVRLTVPDPLSVPELTHRWLELVGNSPASSSAPLPENLEPRPSGGDQTGTEQRLRVVTNLTAPPASVLGWLARFPGTTEFALGLLRHILGCRSVLAADHDPRGIGIHLYWSIVSCLLIALYARGKPTGRTLELVALYLGGLADEAEFLAHVARLKSPGTPKRSP